MSSRRHGAPLIMYSDSPVRNRVRVIVTSENSIGSIPAVLSIVSATSARPSAGRSAVPAKMTSSILPPRSARAPWAPSTHATESTTLDLPEPFGPTTTHTPGSKSSVVLSAKDLKPFSVSDRRNNWPPSPGGDRRVVHRARQGLPAPTHSACSTRLRPPALDRPCDFGTTIRACGSAPGSHRTRNEASPTAAIRCASTASTRALYRPDPAPVDHALDRRFGAFELGFDGAVGPVADEAADAGNLCHVAACVAEPHALHTTGHDHANADRRAYT